LRYRCGDYQVTQKHGTEMYSVAERVKQEYMKYVTDKLCSLDKEVSEYLTNMEDMEHRQQISPEKKMHTINTMYKNYLRYIYLQRLNIPDSETKIKFV
jgi:hypothetical protein